MCKFLTLFVMMVALSFSACQSKQKTGSEDAAEKSCCSSAAVKAEAKAYTPDKLLADGGSLVDKEVEIRGTVSHVCKHAGKKCFLYGENPDVSIQVMANGDIDSFDKELIGSEISVKGVVKEHRIQKNAIEEQEKAVKEEMAKEGCEMERCSHVMSNVNQMKEWMASNGKDYYPVYYVDGVHYDVVQ